jgi:D-tyrosyl-tRNA(Tyr) deacylase
LLQRVSSARLAIEGADHARIGQGLLVLVGVGRQDHAGLCERLADKLVGLRVFEDETGRMNRSLVDMGGELLLASQFTLFADSRNGLRPSFTPAMPPEEARALYEQFVDACRVRLPGRVQTGVFAADMQIALVNEGPVTLLLDTAEWGW